MEQIKSHTSLEFNINLHGLDLGGITTSSFILYSMICNSRRRMEEHGGMASLFFISIVEEISNNLKKAQFGQGLFFQTLSQHCEMPEDFKFPQLKMHLGVLGTNLTPTHFLLIRGMCLGVNNKVLWSFLKEFLLMVSWPSHYIKHQVLE